MIGVGTPGIRLTRNSLEPLEVNRLNKSLVALESDQSLRRALA
jgi:hypothetical protein